MLRLRKYSLFAMCLLLFGCQNTAPLTSEKIDMALITQHNLGNYYQTMLRGAQTAETEITTVDVHFLPVADTMDTTAQSTLIDEAVANQMEAILISPNGSSETQKALERAREAGISIIVIDSPVELEGLTYVGTDNQQLGDKLAQRLQQESLEADQMVIIVPPDQSRNILQRVAAIEKAYASRTIQVLSVSYNLEEAIKQLTAFKKEHPAITQWVPITELMTEAASKAVKLNGWQEAIRIIGVDSNAAILQGLEQGIVERLFVQNSYAMGYLAVYAAYNAQRNIQSPKHQDTLYREVTKDNLFDEALAPILFPMEE